MQVSQQPSLMQTLARLVQPPAEQPRAATTDSRVAESKSGKPGALAADSVAGRRADGVGDHNLLKADTVDLNRSAPRGTYLNIVV